MNSQAIVGIVLGAVLLGGCAGTEVYFDKKTNTQGIDTGSVNALNPSSSVLEVRRCDGPVVDAYTMEEEYNHADGTAYVTEVHYPMTCEDGWVSVAAVPATQPGWMTVWSSVIDGFAFVLGMDRLGHGIGDSGSTTNNTNGSTSNGGQTINSNANLNQAGASATSSSKAFSNSSSSAKGGSVDMGKKHRR